MKNLHKIINNLDEYDQAILWYIYRPFNSYSTEEFKWIILNGQLHFKSNWHNEGFGNQWQIARHRWSESVISQWETAGRPSMIIP